MPSILHRGRVTVSIIDREVILSILHRVSCSPNFDQKGRRTHIVSVLLLVFRCIESGRRMATVDTQSFRVVWHSDGSVTYRGFKLSISLIDAGIETA